MSIVTRRKRLKYVLLYRIAASAQTFVISKAEDSPNHGLVEYMELEGAVIFQIGEEK